MSLSPRAELGLRRVEAQFGDRCKDSAHVEVTGVDHKLFPNVSPAWPPLLEKVLPVMFKADLPSARTVKIRKGGDMPGYADTNCNN
jgi:hypothetical protein